MAVSRKSGPRGEPMKAVPQLDMSRLCNLWHEMARLPHKGQGPDEQHPTVSYSAADDGSITLTHAGASGGPREQLARRPYPIENPGEFKLQTGPGWLRWKASSWQDYWVLALDRQYRWMMVGEPTRERLWIYSRDAYIERGTLDMLKTRARALGYDLAPLLITGTLRTFQPL